MIIRLDEIDSTNEYAKRFVADGWSGEDITVISAQFQSQGKGRRGRGWVSPPGTALMFSLLFKPDASIDDCPMITLVCAMAIREALLDNGVECNIKWPNDIIIKGKKVCGILTEALPDSGYIIVGAGINMLQESWPEELQDKAISVYQAINDAVDEDKLLEDIVFYAEKYLEIWQETKDLSALKEDYNDILVGIGSEVTVLDPKGEFTGISEGINDKGELLVRKADGTVEEVYAGEVSVRGVYGYV